MSLLSPEVLIAYIGTGEVVAVHRRGWSSKIVGQYTLPCAASDPIRASEKRAYDAVADELRRVLVESGARNLRVVLSNHWVHYLIHAWREDAESDEEQQLLARISYSEIYGEVADDWKIVLGDELPGRPRLAAAIDAGLLSVLNDVASSSGVSLKAVQPLLVGVANAAVRQAGKSGGKWIAVHEVGRLTLALIEGGRWIWTRSQRVTTDWAANFSGLLAQEALLAGRGEGAEAIIFAPLIERPEVFVCPGQPARMLALPIAAQLASDPRMAFPLVFA